MLKVPEGVMESGIRTLDIINTVVIILVCTSMLFQLIYFLFFWVKNKKYPKAKTYHKFGVVICARNEEKVIANLINSLHRQDYPKDKFDIFVICHNCSDNTKGVAEANGAIPLVINDDNPKHKRKGFALQTAFKTLLKDYDHEAFIIFDADNLAKSNFISTMNDAFDSGVEVGQGRINFQNFEENVVSEINGIFHLRDASFNHKGRTFIHSTTFLIGTGFYFSRAIIEELGGWNFTNLIEDAEFTVNLALAGHSAKFIADAEFYDEQPTKFKDSLKRQARLGRGSCALFFKYGPKLLWKFITTLKIKYLDLFLSFSYPPIALLCTLWFPFYYCYVPIRHLVMGNVAMFNSFLIFILEMVTICILIPITIQNIIAYIMNWKRLRIKDVPKAICSILLWPFYNLFISLAITYGILVPNLTWTPTVHKSKVAISQIEEDENKN